MQCYHSANLSYDPERPRVLLSRCDVFEDWDAPLVDRWGQHAFIPTGGRIGETRPITMADVRRDFFALIDRTPNLDWLLLTKRPENVRRMWPDVAGSPYIAEAGVMNDFQRCYRSNVWLLASASDQASLEAGLQHLLACRDLCHVLEHLDTCKP